MTSFPPKNITKHLLYNKRGCNLTDELTNEEKLQLRTTDTLTYTAVKFMSDETGEMGFGLSVQRGKELEHYKLALIPWTVRMHQWSAAEWAWFLILIINQTSEAFFSPHLDPCARTFFMIFIDFQYKLKPASPMEFIDELEPFFLQLSELDRFRDNSCSVFYQQPSDVKMKSDTTKRGDVNKRVARNIIFTRSRLMIETDIPRLFDTSWHWKRAAELLHITIEDRSLQPACTYCVGSSHHVYTSDGTFYATALEYIKARLSSPLPPHITSQDKEDVINFIMDVISANTTGSTFDQINNITMSDYLCACASNKAQNAIPRALKAAFKKYDIYVPEMENVVKKCAQCSVPRPKSACACKTASYCNNTCQKQHWKIHKRECPLRVLSQKKTEDRVTPSSPHSNTQQKERLQTQILESKRQRKPSKTAIQTQFDRWIRGDTQCPLPGTEACEAWKAGILAMLTHCSASEKEMLQEAVEQQAETEKAFWEHFPNHSNSWADDS